MKNLWCIAGVALLLVTLSTPAPAQRIKRVSKPLLKPSRTIKPYNIRYFPALKWRVTLGMTRDCAPALADLDLDGASEIIVPALDEQSPKLYCLTPNGDVKWRVPLPGIPTAGVTLGDIDRDGALEILVAAGSTLLCFDGQGQEQWRYVVRIPQDTPTPETPAQPVAENTENTAAEGASTLPEEVAQQPAPEEAETEDGEADETPKGEETQIQGTPSIADIDGDGQSEIIFGANDNRLHVLNSKGRSKWTFKTKSWITGGVAIGNLEGDGKLEIVFGSMDFNIYCLDSSGRAMWKYEAYDWVQGAPVIADVDKDGGLDIVAVADDGWLYCLSRRGTLKWKERVAEQQRMKPQLAVADLDGEGTLETVVALPDGSVRAFTAYGDEAWAVNLDAGVLASPLVADLDGDGWQDILIVTQEGQFRALDTWGREQWRHNLGQTIEATPALADLDRDGKWEIYLANLMSQNRNTGFFSQFELSVNGGKSTWPALKGDPYRTGSALNARDYGGKLRRGSDYATAWEPFFAGSRPRAKLLAPRRLKVTALPLEDVRGNKDGALDPGETALWKIRVQNIGKGASYDTSLRIELPDSPLKLDRTSMFLGWLAPGASKTATFRLTAPPLKELLQLLEQEQQTTFRDIAAPAPSTPAATATLKPPIRKVRRLKSGAQIATLRVTESGSVAALAQATVWNVPPLPPVLKIAKRQLIDSITNLSFGNANSQLDSGETVVLRVLLQNVGLASARTAQTTLSSPSGDVLVATPQAALKDVVPYGGRHVSFSLRVARKLQNKTIRLKLRTEVNTGRGGVSARQEWISLNLKQAGLDTVAPTIQWRSPATRVASTRKSTLVISGIVSDASDLASFTFLKEKIAINSLRKLGPNRYQFVFKRSLRVGENVFAVNATDNAGNSSSQWVRVVRKP